MSLSSPHIETTNQLQSSSGDYSSGEESNCSFVTAYDNFPEDLHYVCRQCSTDLSNATTRASSIESLSCPTEAVDVNIQTSNCVLCRRYLLRNNNKQKDITEADDIGDYIRIETSSSTLLDTSSTDTSCSNQSEVSVTDISSSYESDVSNPKLLTSKITDESSLDFETKVSRSSPEASETPPVTFANRSIHSVARIVVANSVGKGTVAHRAEGPAASQPAGQLHHQNNINMSSSALNGTPSPSTSRLVKHAIWTVENLHDMWSQGHFCNVTIVTSTGKEFSAHRIVLALHSGFFKDVLSRPIDSESKGCCRITLDDSIIDETFVKVLRFMYTSLVQINEGTIAELIKTSVKLSVHRLTRLCLDFIENITVDNALTLLQTAEKIGLSDHIHKTSKFIYENFRAVTATDSFVKLSNERAASLLAHDDLDVDSEIDVFSAAKRWIQRNQGAADERQVTRLIKTIRLELFSPEELADHVESLDWLMKIPGVRVQVLEAYRYLSLSASSDEKLRPPAPRRRGKPHQSQIAPGSSQRMNTFLGLSNHSVKKCDVATSMTGKVYSSSNHGPLGHRQQSQTSTTGDLTNPSRLHGKDTSVEILDKESSGHLTRSMSSRKTATTETFGNDVPLSTTGSRSTRMTPTISSHRETSNINSPRSVINQPTNTSRGHMENTTQSHGSHRTLETSSVPVDDSRSAPMIPLVSSQNKTRPVASYRSVASNGSEKPLGHVENPNQSHGTIRALGTPSTQIDDSFKSGSKQNVRKKSKSSLQKPVSDYRLTNINPRALANGPKAWPTPTNLVPSGAEDETTDLIVVSGGVSTKGDLDLPGRLLEIYDPEINQWRDSIEAPVARNHHVVQFMQDSIYVIGGSDPHGQGDEFIRPTNTVYRYDIRLCKWTEAAPMTSSRIFHQVGSLFGQLYVVGGQDQEGRTLDSVETYMPISDSWRSVAPISTPRYAVAMASYGQRLYVAGGYCEEAGSEMVDTVEYFNPYVEEWTSVHSLRAARCHANLLVAQGRLYLVGGYTLGNDGIDKHSTIDVYDEERKKWCFVTDMEHGRHDGKTVVWHDKLFLMGARSDDDAERPLTRVDYFDTKKEVWVKQATDLTCKRFGHACCIIPSKTATNWL